MTTIRPVTEDAFWILDDINGLTTVGELTGVRIGLPVVWGEGAVEYGAAVADSSMEFPLLPEVGEWLAIGAIYTYGEKLLMVRQSHNRTHYAPEETPALFMVFRRNSAAALDWIAGEQVFVGTIRIYGGNEYECTQAHVTQADWTPPAVPALWKLIVVTPPTSEWSYPVAYKIGDEVTYRGVLYRCRQAHTSQAVWTPPVVPALWLRI